MLRRAAVRRRDPAPDDEPILLPTQVARAAPTPEAALACAVVGQCHLDMIARQPASPRYAMTVEARRRAAVAWVLDEADSEVFSFAWWAAAAGLDPEALRCGWRRRGVLP